MINNWHSVSQNSWYNNQNFTWVCIAVLKQVWRYQWGLQNVVSQRSTDNTMAKMKKKYISTYWYRKTLHRELKISQQEPDDKPGENTGAPEG